MSRQLNITLPPRDPTLDMDEDYEYQDALLLTCTALLLSGIQRSDSRGRARNVFRRLGAELCLSARI